jgi:uncharacterized membrane protein
MSSNGNVVVGNVGAQPFRWEQSVGLQPITGLPNGFAFSADVVSGDGRAIVLNAQPSQAEGVYYSNLIPGNAFQWTATAGLTELAHLAGDAYSHGTASSFDGTTVVGNSVSIGPQGTYENHAMRWNLGVASQLDAPVGFSFSMAKDVSSDGKLVVGTASGQAERLPYDLLLDPASESFVFPVVPTSDRAVIWDANGHAFDLKTFLESRYGLGPRLAGWLLTDATSISDNGSVIAGRGIDPQRQSAIWVAELAIPEPHSAMIAVAAIALLVVHGQRSSRR